MKSNSFAHGHGILLAIAMLSLLFFAGNTQAAPRMYTGSLIIHSFGNPTKGVAGFPASQFGLQIGIPLTGNCNTVPFHAAETITFPTVFPGAISFTIPEYGGQTNVVDVNADTIPDVPAGCTPSVIEAGDPLTGTGVLQTTGLTSTSRAATNPRGFTLPKSALAKVKSGLASFEQYTLYLWEVHYLDLRNSNGATLFGDNGVFGKSLGIGTINVKHGANRSVSGTPNANKFGGVMKLLGTHFSNEGYLLMGKGPTSAAKYTWLFDYLGHGGTQKNVQGDVTQGYLHNETNSGYTLAAGAPFQSNVEVEAFGWTTGMVTATGMQGPFPTVVAGTGYDNRTAMGNGVIQLVSPMLTHWTGNGISSTAAVGIMKLTFAPEPGQWLMLGAGVSMLGLLFRSSRK